MYATFVDHTFGLAGTFAKRLGVCKFESSISNNLKCGI